MDSHLQHLEPRSTLVGLEQERHGLAHGGVDDLHADAESVSVVGERDRGLRAGAATQLQGAAGAGQSGAVVWQVVGPETDVMQI